MLFFRFLKKMLEKISRIISAFLKRLDQKKNNPRGYALGGPKKMRQKVVLFIILIAVLAAIAYAIKANRTPGTSFHFDRETAPGVKIPSNISNSLSSKDMLSYTEAGLVGQTPVDCSRIIANLRLRGTLTERERVDYERSCKNYLSKDMQEIIDKIISGEVPSEAAVEILNQVNEENAGNILRALENEEVKKALVSDSASAIAKNLANLGKLNTKELNDIVAAVRKAPPQFREDIISAAVATADLQNEDARAALIRSISNARSKDELLGIKSFADTIKKAKPEEQKIFAESFEKAPDLATREALRQAANEIIQIDPEDPVRGKLVSHIKEVSSMPADLQKAAYDKFANVAREYRTTTDPELKRAIGDAILAAKSAQDIMDLSDRLDAIREAKKAGGLSRDDIIAAISGNDMNAIDRINAAAELVKSGDMEGASKALDGTLSSEDLQRALERSKERKNDPLSKTNTGQEASREALQKLMHKESQLQNEKENIKRQIDQYITTGISPTDPKLLELYKRLASIDDEYLNVKKQVLDMRSALQKRLNDLKIKTASEFEEAGIAFPEIDIKLPEAVIEKNAPPVRFSNLRDNEEFWSSINGSYQKRKGAKFKFSGKSGANGRGSILSETTEKFGANNVWYVNNTGAGNSSFSNTVNEFQISRTEMIAGVLHRIPQNGIASRNAGETTILFEFIESAANRRTGQIEIPTGSMAICKVKDFDNESGRLNGTCNAVDTGGREDIRVNFILADAHGADGVRGIVRDERGWQLAGIFLTAFSASVLDGVTQQFVTPFETRADKAARDFFMAGVGGGGSAILQDVAAKQIEDWSTSNTYWMGTNGMLATIKQAN